MNPSRLQRTIRHPIVISGFGYWSGEDVRVEFRPAPVGAGIAFVRDDLGPAARVPARCEYRIEIPRRTCLKKDMVQVDMVEHILAALAGMQIDNCEVGVDQCEMPGCDGSAKEFVAALETVGSVPQESEVKQLIVTDHFRLTEGDSWIEAHPSACGFYNVSFTLDYPQDDAIGYQQFQADVTPDNFFEDIAPSRTFILQREADELLKQGLCKRVDLNDLLIFGNRGLMNNKLRFPNECARHKALDVIGDLALTGQEIVGNISAYRSGHRLNAKFAQQLAARFAEPLLKATA
ncbi:UDP-3-O-acyl-N-acetylglucosamine deacetylase [Bythopirellula polymerisocia]|uniref:UDP-3-O-acyl-N-acetylglucosamine deacetylase n=1 Tax=Bythopirellula polymerisocia TaxID=2528003 RepID=A0A5C6CPH7_9BACT|nr:UDP-3-O-acyl-N-acetylglucosamine deacetylase [Bythopirellula polymerisocia]TWU25935.1 UDP-3-O-[3-hydroxymyristoyl] N-acetylglucosamine deacetylase [Bythopirellula polymerisocia]